VNLKQGEGRVPINVGGETPWRLIDWPTKEQFWGLWGRTPESCLDQYWTILQARSGGFSLKEAGLPFNLSRERVRQIEARFQLLMLKQWRVEAVD
jgi:hypothetical protein